MRAIRYEDEEIPFLLMERFTVAIRYACNKI